MTLVKIKIIDTLKTPLDRPLKATLTADCSFKASSDSLIVKDPDFDLLISPITGCGQLRINYLLTINQVVHITYFM